MECWARLGCSSPCCRQRASAEIRYTAVQLGDPQQGAHCVLLGVQDVRAQPSLPRTVHAALSLLELPTIAPTRRSSTRASNSSAQRGSDGGLIRVDSHRSRRATRCSNAPSPPIPKTLREWWAL